MRRLLAIALAAGAIAISVATTVRAQSSPPACPSYDYYNTTQGRCMTHHEEGEAH